MTVVAMRTLLCYDSHMYYATLDTISPQKLYETFIEAFSDYQIPVHMSHQVFEQTNAQRSVSLSDSFGAFSDDGSLVGFILCGVREAGESVDFYDGATAVITSRRKEGIATGLLRAALQRAEERHAGSFILEVIKENEGAQHLYATHGFSVRRNLRCFEIRTEDIVAMYSHSDDILDLDSAHYDICAEAVGLSYQPSWQNDSASIKGIFPFLTVRGIKRDDQWVGYYVLYAGKGDLMCIGAMNDSPEILRILITDACRYSEDTGLGIINIEESSPLCTFLLAEGWSVMIDQWEMVKTL
ncbi:MAG: GNAT family N-acetyltransferase [Sphaerochaetaceae bacterium]|nr:GNAT family N-acetyltransferase [Sphaerochaetaceae bacterium]